MYIDQPAPQIQSKTRRIVIFPIGSCEQHGPYLPIDTDLRIAQLLASKLVDSFGERAFLLPVLPFSSSWEHKGLGTIALNTATISLVLHDVAYSLKTWEMPILLILVNWHGGNSLLASLATEITAREGIPTAAIPTTSQVGKAWDESKITDAKDIHAGAVETSVIQAFWPELIQTPIPENAHYEPAIHPAKAQAVLQAIGSYPVTQDGIWGAPEQADAAKGYALIEKLVKKMHDEVEGLRTLVDHENQ